MHIWRETFLRGAKLSPDFFLIPLSAFLCVWGFNELGVEQRGPHTITTSLNGTILSQFTTTNPEYVSYVGVTNITPDGFRNAVEKRTNYYWKVWGCFR
jgi:hypothetical protein